MNTEAFVILLFPIFFVGLWGLVTLLLAVVGGWTRLAAYYHLQTEFSGETWRFRSGRLGPVSYSGCLTLGANHDGVYLAVLPLFRIGHPPLFIPWYDITTTETKSVLSSSLDFTFTRVSAVRLRLPRRLGEAVVRKKDEFS